MLPGNDRLDFNDEAKHASRSLPLADCQLQCKLSEYAVILSNPKSKPPGNQIAPGVFLTFNNRILFLNYNFPSFFQTLI
ncbi:hypothetical protein FHS68_000043 [Dyadobacter arcticus]|uniref:GRAM domain-containing protein n=1 Tax=Dyadobacter arcticus TaxID=1078754 RepID=A0ABX0UE37_9BACT|nr:hypothetical protein [Dyadobacter arcticus]